MKLFLLRHAPAEYGGPDPERPLSPEGRQQAHNLAQFIRSRPYYAIKSIWCSPYLRARQTAEPFEALLDSSHIKYRNDLVPGADPDLVQEEIQLEGESLLVVGHNPHLSWLASQLMDPALAQRPLSFKKTALFVFKRDSYATSGFSFSAYLPPAALGIKD